MLDWLYARQTLFTPGLERVKALLSRLGHPEEAFPAVLVGGTNGKGSAARALAAILREEGFRVGLYTSPHLVRFHERIAVDGREIPDAHLQALLEEVRPHAEAVGASFFEAATATAFLYFARLGVELAVLEVGLGGRLDATNAATPLVSVVTNVGHDHLEVLGPTLADVAREKAGILRPHCPALTAARGEALSVLKAEAARLGTPLYVLGEGVGLEGVTTSPEGVAFTLVFGERRRLFAPLFGRHQAENLALAAAAARLLGASWSSVERGLARVENPGRLQRVSGLLLDGAHNPEGAWALRQALHDHGLLPAALVLAFSREKDHRGMAEALRGLGPVVLTRYASRRSLPPAELLPLFPGARVEEDPFRAIEEARGLAPNVVVAGSLFLVGQVLRGLAGLPPEERYQ
ncbi:bifunctional folylpolyglutamate synthase/dihydrofolate synthase [Thermus filiformis]|uniref:tetrahydrofolate synthase n=1 Tax=Thermus filiformis TaxID=276 RepID=A0A0A2WVP3_THEFI|nr:folylpolyglutamate synthase/dihydrofolate synthase family protein [Thermus filiformis]KGQ22380.1 folylpolyglutamate synthase [Thermus filiformis]